MGDGWSPFSPSGEQFDYCSKSVFSNMMFEIIRRVILEWPSIMLGFNGATSSVYISVMSGQCRIRVCMDRSECRPIWLIYLLMDQRIGYILHTKVLSVWSRRSRQMLQNWVDYWHVINIHQYVNFYNSSKSPQLCFRHEYCIALPLPAP